MYRVLIVDDEKNVRLGIQAMIQREFKIFDLFVAADGVEAREIMDRQTITPILTGLKRAKSGGP